MDELRGFAVLCMVFYHAFYTFGAEFSIDAGGKLFLFFSPFEPFFAAFFILLSGVCCHLSHSNLMRGLKLAVISVLLSAMTVFLLPILGIKDCEIYFGILHLLALGMLIYGIFGKLIDKINPYFLFLFSAAVFFVTYGVSEGYLGIPPLRIATLPSYLYKTDSLAVLGFYSENFYSADYFPILPWLFAFFCGISLGAIWKRQGFPKFFEKKRIPPLAFLGRHALIVYIIHQPLIYAVAYLINLIFTKGF